MQDTKIYDISILIKKRIRRLFNLNFLSLAKTKGNIHLIVNLLKFSYYHHYMEVKNMIGIVNIKIVLNQKNKQIWKCM